MVMVSLNVSRWRILRLALKKKRSKFEDLRSMRRQDQNDVDWLVKNGLLAEVGDGFYELTDIGRVSADLGYYDWTPPTRPAAPESAAQPAGKRRGKK